MFVQKKYPKVAYTLHIELTEENVERIMGNATALHQHLLDTSYPRSTYPYLFDLLDAIRQEASVPYGC